MININRVMNLKAPTHWDVEDPTNIAKNNAIKVCDILNIDPIVIASTIEYGVYLRFDINNLELICECYNDGDVGVIINQERKIIYSEDIINFDFTEVLKYIK